MFWNAAILLAPTCLRGLRRRTPGPRSLRRAKNPNDIHDEIHRRDGQSVPCDAEKEVPTGDFGDPIHAAHSEDE